MRRGSSEVKNPGFAAKAWVSGAAIGLLAAPSLGQIIPKAVLGPPATPALPVWLWFPQHAFTPDVAGALPAGRLQVVAHYDGNIPTGGVALEVEVRDAATGICCWIIFKVGHNQVIAREYQLPSGHEPTGRFRVSGVAPNGAIDGIAVGLYFRDHSGTRWQLRSRRDSFATVSPNFMGAWPVAWSQADWAARLTAAAAANGPVFAGAAGNPAQVHARMILSGAQMLPDGLHVVPLTPALAGDLDGDGCVDQDDLNIIVNAGIKCLTNLGACPVAQAVYTSDRFGALPTDRVQVVAMNSSSIATPILTIECRDPITRACCDITIILPSTASIVAQDYIMNGFEPTGRFSISGAHPFSAGVAFGVYVREPAGSGGDRWILKSAAPIAGTTSNFAGVWPFNWSEAQWDALLPATPPFQPATFDSFVARRQAQATLTGAEFLHDGTYTVGNHRCIDADLDGDGDVDAIDAAILAGNLGLNCCP